MKIASVVWVDQMTEVGMASLFDGRPAHLAKHTTALEAEGPSTYRTLLHTPAASLFAPMDDHAHCFHAAILGYN
ncbi:hypothetical protein [Paraburkholderia sp. SIMBA_053]|uniref:hypothetical protein n=1 Tax=Paraburkholderia sp. SIMBA_053 TaxID=3085794 RepID=UPI00397D9EAA